MIVQPYMDLARVPAITAWVVFVAIAALGDAPSLRAQPYPFHYPHSAHMPPGAVARDQLERGLPLRGYIQPVSMRVPRGARVWVAEGGAFQPEPAGPVTLGLRIGEVYRLKITDIPRQEGLEVFPTVEVVNRLYPPRGMRTRFPVPIELTQEDIQLALSGRFVTRVIYLEPPALAFPEREDPRGQRYFEVLPAEDPLRVADELGRPMAILRLGSRVPDADQLDEDFLYGSPAVVRYPQVVESPVEQNASPAPPSTPQELPPPQSPPNDQPAPRQGPEELRTPHDPGGQPSARALEYQIPSAEREIPAARSTLPPLPAEGAERFPQSPLPGGNGLDAHSSESPRPPEEGWGEGQLQPPSNDQHPSPDPLPASDDSRIASEHREQLAPRTTAETPPLLPPVISVPRRWLHEPAPVLQRSDADRLLNGAPPERPAGLPPIVHRPGVAR